MIIQDVVQQHTEEAAVLHGIRTVLARAPHVTLRHLGRFDDRLLAHLAGLSVAGREAWRFVDAALEMPTEGAVFTAAVIAIEQRVQERLDKVFALAEAIPETRAGLLAAFGWLEPELLRGTVAGLLASEDPLRRMVGIAACAMHHVDPGLVSARRLRDRSADVRARALRTVGEIGCHDALTECTGAIRDQDANCGFWAARSSTLLGHRGVAIEVLTGWVKDVGPHQLKAFRLVLQAMSLGESHAMLKELGAEAEQICWLIRGSGITGDPRYVPWLLGHMAAPKTARVAGEAFSLITGVDLAEAKLETDQPDDFESGPTDDPDDPSVAMDPDDGLPWPEVPKVENWWSANSHRFQAGIRYFVGAPVTRGHCLDVLKNGFQRQRILAASYLCLLEPGTPLFNTSAPAWRQQRLLAKMT